ncbi:hypothetical protein CMT52_13205 [Elizabethkingia anophelis]|nr:hypothetical protein [Elizabethkingia anophelis]MDV4025289.1 hypothetical protein [Elizabethkingia anophelis]
MSTNDEKKRKYLPPKIEVDFIEMEQGIAAGSATVIPTNSSGQVQEEWTTGNDTTGDMNW